MCGGRDFPAHSCRAQHSTLRKGEGDRCARCPALSLGYLLGCAMCDVVWRCYEWTGEFSPSTPLDHARRDTLVCLMRAVTDLGSPNTKGPSVGSRGQLQRRKMLPPHHVWDSTIIAFRSFKADLRPHRKASKGDRCHGWPLPILAISSPLRRRS